jgi:hypothetical protein
MYTGFMGRSAAIGGVKQYILLIMAGELVHRIKKNTIPILFVILLAMRRGHCTRH